MNVPFDFEKFRKLVDIAVELLSDGTVTPLAGTVSSIAEFTVENIRNLGEIMQDYKIYMTMSRAEYKDALRILRDLLRIRKQMMSYIYDKLIEFIEKELGDEQQ